eukprot:10981229-Lingulodinium_polyedra.AAC.1
MQPACTLHGITPTPLGEPVEWPPRLPHCSPSFWVASVLPRWLLLSQAACPGWVLVVTARLSGSTSWPVPHARPTEPPPAEAARFLARSSRTA